MLKDFESDQIGEVNWQIWPHLDRSAGYFFLNEKLTENWGSHHCFKMLAKNNDRNLTVLGKVETYNFICNIVH